jgi:hypothetical protein
MTLFIQNTFCAVDTTPFFDTNNRIIEEYGGLLKTEAELHSKQSLL